jgi:small subunit ribosomal protein S21
MAEIHVREGESLENALKRFRREVKKSNIFSELKRKRHYEKPSERRQRKLRNRNRRTV